LEVLQFFTGISKTEEENRRERCKNIKKEEERRGGIGEEEKEVEGEQVLEASPIP